MDTREMLVTYRDVFFKCFLIALMFLLVAVFIYLPCKCAIANFYFINLGIRPDVYSNFWVGFIGLVKTILVFGFLTPALAFHWALVDYDKRNKV